MIYFIPTTQPTKDLKRIIDYLLTLMGDVQVKTKSATSANIFYSHISTPSTLTLKKDKIELDCSPYDNLSAALIKNLNLRLYHSKLKTFVPNERNLLDLTTTKTANKIFTILKKYQLKPLFRYNNSLVFFAKDKQNRIHLVNHSLLKHLMNHSQKKLYPKHLSLIVAPDIKRFVALMDRGLITHSFYQSLNNNPKIINLSGFNVDKLPQKVMVKKIIFSLDLNDQTFSQGSYSLMEVKKGQSLIKSLKIKNFLSLKITRDIRYDIKNNTLIPKLKVYIFIDA